MGVCESRTFSRHQRIVPNRSNPSLPVWRFEDCRRRGCPRIRKVLWDESGCVPRWLSNGPVSLRSGIAWVSFLFGPCCRSQKAVHDLWLQRKTSSRSNRERRCHRRLRSVPQSSTSRRSIQSRRGARELSVCSRVHRLDR